MTSIWESLGDVTACAFAWHPPTLVKNWILSYPFPLHLANIPEAGTNRMKGLEAKGYESLAWFHSPPGWQWCHPPARWSFWERTVSLTCVISEKKTLGGNIQVSMLRSNHPSLASPTDPEISCLILSSKLFRLTCQVWTHCRSMDSFPNSSLSEGNQPQFHHCTSKRPKHHSKQIVQQNNAKKQQQKKKTSPGPHHLLQIDLPPDPDPLELPLLQPPLQPRPVPRAPRVPRAPPVPPGHPPPGLPPPPRRPRPPWEDPEACSVIQKQTERSYVFCLVTCSSHLISS